MVSVGGEVGCLTLMIVLVAVFGGIWLDRVLGTKPIFTILLVVGSAPFALVLTFWLAMRAVKDIAPPAGAKQNLPQGPAAPTSAGVDKKHDEEGDDDW